MIDSFGVPCSEWSAKFSHGPGARDWLGMRDYYSFVRAVRDGCLKHNTEQPNAELLGAEFGVSQEAHSAPHDREHGNRSTTLQKLSQGSCSILFHHEFSLAFGPGLAYTCKG